MVFLREYSSFKSVHNGREAAHRQVNGAEQVILRSDVESDIVLFNQL